MDLIVDLRMIGKELRRKKEQSPLQRLLIMRLLLRILKLLLRNLLNFGYGRNTDLKRLDREECYSFLV
jgi:hypothetical protein